jgi:UDPglucose--hexose-1-phosphate uridylyltransferase
MIISSHSFVLGNLAFESMIISKRAVQHIGQMNEAEKMALADMYRRLTIMYDNLFQVSFAYSAGIHQAPTDGKDHPPWHFHMHFYPPLLRSASVKKFMVGYEMLANPSGTSLPKMQQPAYANFRLSITNRNKPTSR